MHVPRTQGKDGSRGVVQIWVEETIEFAVLAMNKFPNFTIKLCITDDDRRRLKTGLRRKGNLGDHWSTSAIEPVISVSAKLDFVEGMIDIMPNGNDKETVTSILEDKTFPFAYDVRTTPQGEFPDSGRIDIKAFKQDSKVAVEMQIHSRNFKTKATDGTGLGYLFSARGGL